MKIELELKGFTPVPDQLIEEFNVTVAAIYGVVWRYCQMEDRVCKASLEKVGARVGMSAKSAERHVSTLVEAGYLTDLTPDVKHKPHEYALTDKLSLYGSVVAGEGGQTKSRTKVRQNVSPRYDNLSVKDTYKERESRESERAQFSEADKKRLNALADELSAFLGIKIETASEATKTKLQKFILRIDDDGRTVDDVRTFKSEWLSWAKTPPRLSQLETEWDRFFSAEGGSENKSTAPQLTAEQLAALEVLQGE